MAVDVEATIERIYDDVVRRNPAEPEFHQAVREVLDSLGLVLARHGEYAERKTIERMCEPERQVIFRVPWQDDRGEVWINLAGRLYRSTDAAASFKPASGTDISIDLFGLGKAAAGSRTPALYAIGTQDGVKGVWRSTDGGAQWVRINDDAHQWGLRFRAISGDPRQYGRVYVATDGRGIVYGDPTATERSNRGSK